MLYALCYIFLLSLPSCSLYLTFLHCRPETRTPTLGNFGFQFLLVFVFATIPAGIYGTCLPRTHMLTC
jgi:hypothetical protein